MIFYGSVEKNVCVGKSTELVVTGRGRFSLLVEGGERIINNLLSLYKIHTFVT